MLLQGQLSSTRCALSSRLRSTGPVRLSLGNKQHSILKPINVATFPESSITGPKDVKDGKPDLSAKPNFTLQDVRAAIPAHCFEKDLVASMAYLAIDVGVVTALAVAAFTLNQWWAWPLYWFAQGTMFWSLFVVGHDCGHQSFSNSKFINDLMGNIVHSSILVPYHGWRVSHRKHHAHHGHVDNDESWHPTPKNVYDEMPPLARVGRLQLPWPILAFPFYLWMRSPGKEGSHFDPKCDLFTPAERIQVHISNAFLVSMVGVLVAFTVKLGVPAMFNLYFMPYWFFVMWLDVVTYLQHHGSHDPEERLPWFRGEEWSYLRGALNTLDRDYGIFNRIQHNIGIHVAHHVFPQIPHYHLEEATQAIKPVLGPYYREPVKSPGWFPYHLLEPLQRSFANDHFVQGEGNIVYYERDPELSLENALKQQK